MENKEGKRPPVMQSLPQVERPGPIGIVTTRIALVSFCLALIGSTTTVGFIIYDRLLDLNKPINLPNGQIMFFLDSRDFYGDIVNLTAIVGGILGWPSPWGKWAIGVATGGIGLDVLMLIVPR